MRSERGKAPAGKSGILYDAFHFIAFAHAPFERCAPGMRVDGKRIRAWRHAFAFADRIPNNINRLQRICESCP
jgi:hypothetical protein